MYLKFKSHRNACSNVCIYTFHITRRYWVKIRQIISRIGSYIVYVYRIHTNLVEMPNPAFFNILKVISASVNYMYVLIFGWSESSNKIAVTPWLISN